MWWVWGERVCGRREQREKEISKWNGERKGGERERERGGEENNVTITILSAVTHTHTHTHTHEIIL